MDKLVYKSALNKVFWGVMACIILVVASNCIGIFVNNSLLITLLFPIAVVAAYVYYVISLGTFCKTVDSNDIPAVKRMRISAVLSVIGYLIAIIVGVFSVDIKYMLSVFIEMVNGAYYDAIIVTLSILAFCYVIVIVVSMFFELYGFYSLKQSETFPGKKGANIVYISLVFNLIGTIILFLSVQEFVLYGSIFVLTAFVMRIVGWIMIKKS